MIQLSVVVAVKLCLDLAAGGGGSPRGILPEELAAPDATDTTGQAGRRQIEAATQVSVGNLARLACVLTPPLQ